MVRTSWRFAGRHILLRWGALLALVMVTGCQLQESTTEDNHDHASEHGDAAMTAEAEASHADHDSLSEIVPLLQQHCDAVRDAFAAGTPENADDAIHAVAHLCQHLPAAGGDAGLDATQQAELAMAADKLYQAFNEIHAGFHTNEEGKKYDEVSDDIDEALQTLKALAQ